MLSLYFLHDARNFYFGERSRVCFQHFWFRLVVARLLCICTKQYVRSYVLLGTLTVAALVKTLSCVCFIVRFPVDVFFIVSKIPSDFRFGCCCGCFCCFDVVCLLILIALNNNYDYSYWPIWADAMVFVCDICNLEITSRRCHSYSQSHVSVIAVCVPWCRERKTKRERNDGERERGNWTVVTVRKYTRNKLHSQSVSQSQSMCTTCVIWSSEDLHTWTDILAFTFTDKQNSVVIVCCSPSHCMRSTFCCWFCGSTENLKVTMAVE